MPTKPKKPCRYQGCPELTGGRYCDTHKKLMDARYNKQRDPDTWGRYDYRWRKIRATYIAKHPLCEQCKLAGRLTPAQEVHHKKPLADGGTHAIDNLMSLCTSCHSTITAKESGCWGIKKQEGYLPS